MPPSFGDTDENMDKVAADFSRLDSTVVLSLRNASRRKRQGILRHFAIPHICELTEDHF